MTNTITVVTVVSLRVGQVTFCASARTSCRNLNGLIFAMVPTVGIGSPNRYSAAQPLRMRPAQPILFGEMFAAEVRYRAAGDREASYCQPPKPSSAEALVGVEAARRHPSSLVGVLIGRP